MTGNSHASEKKPQQGLKRSHPESHGEDQSTKKQCITQSDDNADEECDNWSVAASVGDDPGSADDLPELAQTEIQRQTSGNGQLPKDEDYTNTTSGGSRNASKGGQEA